MEGAAQAETLKLSSKPVNGKRTLMVEGNKIHKRHTAVGNKQEAVCNGQYAYIYIYIYIYIFIYIYIYTYVCSHGSRGLGIKKLHLTLAETLALR